MEFGKSAGKSVPLRFSTENEETRKISQFNSPKTASSGEKASRFNIKQPPTLIMIALQIVVVAVVLILNNTLNTPIQNNLRIYSVLNDLSRLITIPPTTLPSQINTIGDGVLPKIEELKKIGPIQADVFKDSKDGDTVIVYAGETQDKDRMIVYRDSEKKVLYDGETISYKDQKARNELLNRLVTVVKDSGLIDKNSEEVPSTQIVADFEKFKSENNSSFYQNVQNNDVIAFFKPKNGESLTVIYRPSTNLIVKKGFQIIELR